MRAFGVWPGFVERDRAGCCGFEHALLDLAHDVHLAWPAIKTQREPFFAVDEL